jgi:hypothetical protein
MSERRRDLINAELDTRLGRALDQISEDSIKRWLKEMIAIPSENPMDGPAGPGVAKKNLASTTSSR